LPQKKRPHHQLPTQPQTSIGRFSWQFESTYGSANLQTRPLFVVSDSHSVCVARHQRRHQRKYRYLVKLSKQYKYM